MYDFQNFEQTQLFEIGQSALCIDKGSLQAVLHPVIYSPGRNQMSHNNLRHYISSSQTQLFKDNVLSKCTHNILTLLAADSGAFVLNLLGTVTSHVYSISARFKVPLLPLPGGLGQPQPPLPPYLLLIPDQF